MELKDRKKQILKAIVDNYIDTGIPIGSKAVVDYLQVNLSTATVRNEMAALEEMGFLVQPHISAGRIPSDLAYRMYVDGLMEIETMDIDSANLIKDRFDQKMDDVKEVIKSTVNVLSDITNCVAVAILPKYATIEIKKIHLVPVTTGKAVVVIVTNHGVIKDRVIKYPAEMDPNSLQGIADMLLEKLNQKEELDLDHIPKADIFNELDKHSTFVHDVIDILGDCFEADKDDIVLGGTTNVFDFPEYKDIGKAKLLIQSFEDKNMLMDVLNAKFDGRFNVVIGDENQYEGIKDCSLITVNYNFGEHGVGSLGIIGPKRMDYAKMFVILEMLGSNINELLKN